MISSMLYQQLMGVINLSIPLVIFYYFYPHYVFSFWGIICSSLLVGLYVAYLTYRNTKQQAESLKFIPAEHYRQILQSEMVACGLQPETVSLRYAYADDGVAMTLLNTIAIDPMLWKEIDDDAEFLKTKDVIEKFILPGVPESKKTFHAKIKKCLLPDAQMFIFRHELGHVYYNYSYKRIVLAGIIGTIAASSGLLAAWEIMASLGGVGALGVGILVGATVDLLLSYASNVFFKAREEKKADTFAANNSSKKEIEAAADFFEHYEGYAQEYRKSMGGVIASMPTILLSGHIDGITRAKYLKDISCSSETAQK